jgi:hypothetical protein
LIFTADFKQIISLNGSLRYIRFGFIVLLFLYESFNNFSYRRVMIKSLEDFKKSSQSKNLNNWQNIWDFQYIFDRLLSI